jgi:hypothetical protein
MEIQPAPNLLSQESPDMCMNTGVHQEQCQALSSDQFQGGPFNIIIMMRDTHTTSWMHQLRVACAVMLPNL